VQSSGLAFLFVPISTVHLRYPQERTSYATGLFNLARNVGGSAGNRDRHHPAGAARAVSPANAGSHMTPYDSAYRDSLAGATQLLHAHGATLPDAAAQAPACSTETC